MCIYSGLVNDEITFDRRFHGTQSIFPPHLKENNHVGGR